MPGPLDGVTVVDLTHVLNGPFCTMLLAHMGARVVKIEHGEGDRFRHAWMPPDACRDGYEFLVVNTNKQGVTLNLKHEKGKQIFLDLVKVADVVVENFSLGVMDRLGLGYEKLRQVNPRLIYASTKGYGESGPYAHVRANAATIMAVTGWTHTSHEFAGRGGTKPLGIGDEAAGVSLALGICSALYAREKTGKGQKIEVAMQEAQLGFMVSPLHTHFEGQPIAAPPKECADGYYAFHLPDIPDSLWVNLMVGLGRPEVADDPRFATSKLRRENYAAVEQIVSDAVRGKTRAELWEILGGLGISSAPVLTLDEVLQDKHLEARGAFQDVTQQRAGTIRVLSPWIHFSETPAAITAPAPEMGEHNAIVYPELLGISGAEVDELSREGVV